jgi:hypothetical protein
MAAAVCTLLRGGRRLPPQPMQARRPDGAQPQRAAAVLLIWKARIATYPTTRLEHHQAGSFRAFSVCRSDGGLLADVVRTSRVNAVAGLQAAAAQDLGRAGLGSHPGSSIKLLGGHLSNRRIASSVPRIHIRIFAFDSRGMNGP